MSDKTYLIEYTNSAGDTAHGTISASTEDVAQQTIDQMNAVNPDGEYTIVAEVIKKN